MSGDRDFQALKPKESEARKKLETFETPPFVKNVVMKSDEVTSLCPITSQPDFETIIIEYTPDKLCIESKSLKLYFFALRDEGAFIEDLAWQIARDVALAAKPVYVQVKAIQKPRGGIEIIATAELQEDDIAQLGERA